MPIETLHPPITPAEYDALVDTAKARAHQLRREAVDALWRDMGGLCQTAPGLPAGAPCSATPKLPRTFHTRSLICPPFTCT